MTAFAMVVGLIVGFMLGSMATQIIVTAANKSRAKRLKRAQELESQ